MGLAIVDTFIKSNGGFVDLISHPGASTTFEIYLTATQTHFLEHDQTRGPATVERDERLLVVDSNAEIRDLLEQVLTDLGYAVQVNEDLAYSLARLAQSRADRSQPLPQLLIIEAEALPGVGDESLDLIRRLAPHVPILLTSAGAVPDQALQSRPGVVGVLYKPFAMEVVAETVLTALSGPGVSRSDRLDEK